MANGNFNQELATMQSDPSFRQRLADLMQEFVIDPSQTAKAERDASLVNAGSDIQAGAQGGFNTIADMGLDATTSVRDLIGGDASSGEKAMAMLSLVPQTKAIKPIAKSVKNVKKQKGLPGRRQVTPGKQSVDIGSKPLTTRRELAKSKKLKEIDGQKQLPGSRQKRLTEGEAKVGDVGHRTIQPKGKTPPSKLKTGLKALGLLGAGGTASQIVKSGAEAVDPRTPRPDVLPTEPRGDDFEAILNSLGNEELSFDALNAQNVPEAPAQLSDFDKLLQFIQSGQDADRESINSIINKGNEAPAERSFLDRLSDMLGDVQNVGTPGGVTAGRQRQAESDERIRRSGQSTLSDTDALMLQNFLQGQQKNQLGLKDIQNIQQGSELHPLLKDKIKAQTGLLESKSSAESDLINRLFSGQGNSNQALVDALTNPTN